MTTVRPPAVAGLFYPDDPEILAAMVDADLADAAADRPTRAGAHPPKALVVPHAGYVYSGPVAGSGYAHIVARRDTVTRVVVLGPSHRVALRGMALPTVDAFTTPLGPVPIDDEARRIALDCADTVLDDRPHRDEHGIEVHLPFLQRVLGPAGPDRWQVLPVVVGDTPPDVVAALLDRLWGGPETVIVVSSDLSHYHDQTTARRLDARTAHAVVAGDESQLGAGDACGIHPLRGLLVAARRHHADITLLDLRTSADTAGDPSRVVGYGAFAVG